MGITAVVCLDDSLGMTFNSRRQSRDRVLIEELLSSTEGDIYIHPYSLPLFPKSDRIKVSEDPLKDCDGGICFIENLPLIPYEDKIDQLIIYRWHRSYPADTYFDLKIDGKRRTFAKKFKGSSHDKITKEIFKW